MKLQAEDLTPWAVGLEEAKLVDGAWFAHRHRPEARSAFDEGPQFDTRMACPAGVRLRFTSDTRWIRLGLTYTALVRPMMRCALVTSRGLVHSVGPMLEPEADEWPLHWEGELFHQRDRQEQCFDLWLPHLAVAGLRYIELEDGSSLQPGGALPVRWLALGDSITQGTEASLPTHTAVGRASLSMAAQTLNLGVGGAVLRPELAEMAGSFQAGQWDVASVAFGTNDFNRGQVSVDGYQRLAGRVVEALLKADPGRPVVLITPPPFLGREDQPNALGHTLEDFRRALRPVAESFERVHLLEGPEAVPASPECFVEDGVHPNDKGFERYAHTLTRRFIELLDLPAASTNGDCDSASGA